MTAHTDAHGIRRDWWHDLGQLAFAAEQAAARDLWRCRHCGVFVGAPVMVWAFDLHPMEPRELGDMLTLCLGCADLHGNRCDGR